MVYGCFIFSTYHDPACPDTIDACCATPPCEVGGHSTPRVLKIAEIVLMVILGIDFLLFFLISENRIEYIFSVQHGLVFYLPFFSTCLIRFEII